LGLEITAALLDMLAGWQNSPDEHVGHKLHSLRERERFLKKNCKLFFNKKKKEL
jgi:hypothetical protein